MTVHRIKREVFDVMCDVCFGSKSGVTDEKSRKFAMKHSRTCQIVHGGPGGEPQSPDQDQPDRSE